jgi:hypothetical protein
LANGSWIKLTEGTCIGHKHIAPFDDATVTKVRLTVTEAIAKPIIRCLSVFHIE